jgi:quercetin dioxygenase-like cupin family protein
LKVVMDDGTEEEFGPGDTAVIPPGHNAWVVGNEPVVAVDFTGLKDYARKS